MSWWAKGVRMFVQLAVVLLGANAWADEGADVEEYVDNGGGLPN